MNDLTTSELHRIVEAQGYQAVLAELCVIAGKSIIPNIVGYDIVWAASKDLNQLFYKLDQVKKGEAR